MNNCTPWLEATGVLGLAGLGVLVGLWFSRMPKPYWMLGYFLPLLAILIYGAAARFHALALCPPVSWMLAGRTKFALIGIITTMLLTTPLSRLRTQSIKNLVSVVMVMVVLKLSVWPFLAPAFNRESLLLIHTRLDSNGICRQNTDYTCGPAAAVTALRKFCLSADEGQIAVLAHTSSAIGTPPDILATALREKYASQGLSSEYRLFHNLDELNHSGLTLVVTKYRPWVDHYVVVLEITQEQVVIGDPLLGLRRLSRHDFEQIWRAEGVLLHRTLPSEKEPV